MNQLSAALRQFADRIDRGEALAGATQCALVLADEKGQAQATYIGTLAPAARAGVQLLASGIQRFNAEQALSTEQLFAARGSTR